MTERDLLNSSILLTVVDRVAQAIASFDSDHRLIVANRRYADLLKLPAALTELGTPFAEIIRHKARIGLYGSVDESGPSPIGRIAPGARPIPSKRFGAAMAMCSGLKRWRCRAAGFC